MYRTYYRPMTARSRKPRQGHTDLVMGADRIWGAAAYADRINGGEYRKESEYRVTEDGRITDEVVRQANKNIMWEAIMDTSRITAEDVNVGRAALDYVRKTLVIKGLKGSMSDFDQALSRVVEMTEFMTGADRYEIALVTSQIRAYREGTRIEAVMTDVVNQPLAEVGAKVAGHARVVKSVFSQNYNVYFVTAKTDTNHMVFFSYRERLAVDSEIDFRGTVKAHRTDATQLNRVRLG